MMIGIAITLSDNVFAVLVGLVATAGWFGGVVFDARGWTAVAATILVLAGIAGSTGGAGAA